MSGTGPRAGRPALRLAVLASGAGTLLEAILDDGLPVVVVGVDRPCRAASVAEGRGVALEVVPRESFGVGFDRRAYTRRLTERLVSHRVDAVAMAGFGTVLSDELFATWPGRVLNTHPSLLPAFPGWHAVRDALAAGVEETGCTVHVATPAVDAGPVLAQARVPVLPADDEDSLHERIKATERVLYPRTIRRFLDELGQGPVPLRAGDEAAQGAAERRTAS